MPRNNSIVTRNTGRSLVKGTGYYDGKGNWKWILTPDTNWKAAARKGEGWSKEIGEATTRKRNEAPKKKKKNCERRKIPQINNRLTLSKANMLHLNTDTPRYTNFVINGFILLRLRTLVRFQLRASVLVRIV